MQQSDPGTLPQLSHCPGSCPRCPDRVVLPGLLLIFHDGNQLVPVGAVSPPLAQCGYEAILSKILNGTQSNEIGLYDLGSSA
ncbi:hypothetical protein NHX12_015507, partial [Muraenolepis orangiensis]